MSDDLLFLVLAAAALSVIYKVWQVSLDARETANRIARDTCSKAVVQFLDDTVAFAGFRLTRDSRGRRRFLRTYTFDYTNDGFERAQGFVILAGLRLEAVGLAGDCHSRDRFAHALQPLRWFPYAGRVGAARLGFGAPCSRIDRSRHHRRPG